MKRKRTEEKEKEKEEKEEEEEEEGGGGGVNFVISDGIRVLWQLRFSCAVPCKQFCVIDINIKLFISSLIWGNELCREDFMLETEMNQVVPMHPKT